MSGGGGTAPSCSPAGAGTSEPVAPRSSPACARRPGARIRRLRPRCAVRRISRLRWRAARASESVCVQTSSRSSAPPAWAQLGSGAGLAVLVRHRAALVPVPRLGRRRRLALYGGHRRLLGELGRQLRAVGATAADDQKRGPGRRRDHPPADVRRLSPRHALVGLAVAVAVEIADRRRLRGRDPLVRLAVAVTVEVAHPGRVGRHVARGHVSRAAVRRGRRPAAAMGSPSPRPAVPSPARTGLSPAGWATGAG